VATIGVQAHGPKLKQGLSDQNRSEHKNWLVVSTPLKNMKVSWDDYSQYMEKKNHVPNHQPENDSFQMVESARCSEHCMKHSGKSTRYGSWQYISP